MTTHHIDIEKVSDQEFVVTVYYYGPCFEHLPNQSATFSNRFGAESFVEEYVDKTPQTPIYRKHI